MGSGVGVGGLKERSVANAVGGSEVFLTLPVLPLLVDWVVVRKRMFRRRTESLIVALWTAMSDSWPQMREASDVL